MRRIVVDANLLVLLIVGLAGRNLIAGHKRLSAFRPADFDLLVDQLRQFDSTVLLPNTITEASALAGQITGPAKPRVLQTIAAIALDWPEAYVPSAAAVVSPEYGYLGLSDGAILLELRDDDTLLTTDFNLFLAALARGMQSINFNHLREFPG